MQTAGAYVDQIPPGARTTAPAPEPLKIAPNSARMAQRPPPPGLYVQIADVLNGEQAIEAGLAFAQRLGARRPPFIRGEAASVQGQPRLLMYAGPFVDAAAAQTFCAHAIPQQTCLTRLFAEPPPSSSRPNAPQIAGPTGVGP